MNRNPYTKGQLVRVKGVFTNTDSGSAIDPTTVQVKYEDPDGTKITLTYGVDSALIKDSVGNYHADLNANKTGIWVYRFESTGVGQAANEREFYVQSTDF